MSLNIGNNNKRNVEKINIFWIRYIITKITIGKNFIFCQNWLYMTIKKKLYVHELLI